MFKRIAAITAIFLCACVAWVVLGSTIFYRTDNSGSALSGRVTSTWGAPQEQKPPSIGYRWLEDKTVTAEENGQIVKRVDKVTMSAPAAIAASRIVADLRLDYRQKGLLWFSTYGVKFEGSYTFRNPSAKEEHFIFTLPLPAQQALYDNVEISLDGQPLPLTFSGTTATAQSAIAMDSTHILRAAYRSQGLESWRYNISSSTPESNSSVSQARDFDLVVRTDFSGFDFPENAMSPTEKRRTANGWELEWKYQNLVSGFDIALKMPQKLQPGPLAGRISFFAPVSLFFFFFLIFILSTLRGIDLHPMNYFFLACAFFSFHLLMAYLVDHVSIHVAFAAASVVSIALVVSYLRLVVNPRFALVDAGVAQLIYLVLFSYAFFFEGFTGLAVTIGAIVTLFVVMQMTGRIHWGDKVARKDAPPPPPMSWQPVTPTP
jgi:inner membrane protein involved in colicin E2 resistance